MRLLNYILAYGASLMVTIVVVAIYIPTLIIVMIPSVIAITKTYIRNCKELLQDILEVD